MKNRKAMLIRDEGLCLMPYRCPTGHLTIGVGHNIESDPLPPEMQALIDQKLPITEKMALDLLDHDDARFEAQAKTFPWFESLSEDRQDVIVMMIFNMGLPKFKEFKKFIAAIEDEDFALASREMMNSKWATQVKDRASRYAKMMREG